MKVKPLADRIIVKPEPAREETFSGFAIPDTAQEKPMRGEIIAVGRGKNINEPVECKIGETALYGKYAGTEVEIDGETIVILRESDIYATI